MRQRKAALSWISNTSNAHLLPIFLQEIKAKEMEELAQTLAELGIAAPAAQDEEGGEAGEEKKKKKKKDKKLKDNGEVLPSETNGTAKENEPMEEPEEEDSSESMDPAEVSNSFLESITVA